MKPKHAFLSSVPIILAGGLILSISLALLLTARKESIDNTSTKPSIRDKPNDAVYQRIQSMASVSGELKSSPQSGRAPQHIGELWLQTARLKRTGINTKNLEGRLSDMEGNLRLSQKDPNARRHLANEVDYEIEALRRRTR